MNFMPTLADCRIIPEHLRRTYRKLKIFYEGKEG